MFQLVVVAFLAVTVSAAPGLPALSLDGVHGAVPALLPAAPVFKAALPASVFVPAPVFDHGPIFAPAPVFSHAPIVASAPTIIKAAAPAIAAPIAKAVAPATSYATVTQVHVSHPQAIVKVAQPLLKTVVAPQPIIVQPAFKGLELPTPEFSYRHDLSYH